MLSQSQIQTLLVKGSQDQGPEHEGATLSFSELQPVETPTSLRTDRKIKFICVKLKGRITVGAGVVTFRSGPTILGTPLFSLFQLITLSGDHLQYGSMTPVSINGETLAEYLASTFKDYVPWFSNSVNGAAAVKGLALSGAANDTNDFELVLPIPTFPAGISMSDANLYCIHGPDWPGNLYLSLQCADVTALGVTTASIANGGAVTAFGSAAGHGSIDIYTERPLLTKQLAQLIRPAITMLIEKTQQPTAAVASGGGSGSTLLDLKVGWDTTRIFGKFGTSQAGTSGGVTAFATLLDTIVNNFVFSLDERVERFQGSQGDAVVQDYVARAKGRAQHIGYRMIDFISTPGSGPDNPRAAFPSSQLTAARKFQALGDVTAAAGQIASIIQEMTIGSPSVG